VSESDGYVSTHFAAHDREGNAEAEQGICERSRKNGFTFDYMLDDTSMKALLKSGAPKQAEKPMRGAF